MVPLWCDRLIFFFLCVLVFVLPATTAGVEIFAGLSIAVLLVKKAVAFASACAGERVGGCRVSPGRAVASLGLPQPAPAVSVPVGVFTGLCVVSILFSIDPSLSANAFVGKTLKVVLLFFAAQESLTTRVRMTWFIRACLVSALLLCLDALWQRYTGFDIFKHHPLWDGRSNASFHHPNGLGAYLIVMVPLVLVSAFIWVRRAGENMPRRIVRALIGAAAAALFMVVMGLTFSRGAWFGLACAGIASFLFDKRAWVPAVVIAGLFFFAFNPLLMHGRQVTLITDNVDAPGADNMGGNGRISFWGDALRIIAEHPVKGAGLNTYTKKVREFSPENRNYAHNCYLQAAAELGLTGLAAFVWLLAAVFVSARRKILAAPASDERWLLIALVAGWIGLLVQSGVDNIFYSVQLGVLVWLVMGAIMAFPSRH